MFYIFTWNSWNIFDCWFESKMDSLNYFSHQLDAYNTYQPSKPILLNMIKLTRVSF